MSAIVARSAAYQLGWRALNAVDAARDRRVNAIVIGISNALEFALQYTAIRIAMHWNSRSMIYCY